MKLIVVSGIGLLATAALGQAQTISNPWSGVTGDRGNMVGFAFKATGGNYPGSVAPADSLTPLFTIDSLTLLRPNDTTTPNFGTGDRLLTDANAPVFVDIYTTYSGGVFSDYVGSSSSSVTWSSTVQDQAYTFNFTGINLQDSTKYWFVFSEDGVAGEVSNFRAKLNTSGDDLTAGPGKGYLVGDTAQAITQAGVLQDWGFAYTVGFTPVPEPSVVSLGLLGVALLAWRRSRVQ